MKAVKVPEKVVFPKANTGRAATYAKPRTGGWLLEQLQLAFWLV